MRGYQVTRKLEYQVNEFEKFLIKDESKSILEENKLITGFERLWVWQKAFKLMQEIHRFCKNLPKEEQFQIKDQIERSSSSVCDNISEGYSSYYYNDKIKGFNVARKEVGETQNHIRKLIGKDYINIKKGESWIREYEEIARGINGFIKYIRNKRKK